MKYVKGNQQVDLAEVKREEQKQVLTKKKGEGFKKLAGMTQLKEDIQSEVIEMPFVDAYVEQCQHLCAVVQGTQMPIIDAENGTRSLDATLAAVRAATEGTRVILDLSSYQDRKNILDD